MDSNNKILEDALSNSRNEINRLLNITKVDKENMNKIKEEYENRLKQEEIEREKLNVIIKNKTDLYEETEEATEHMISVSAATGRNSYELKEMIGRLAPKEENDRKIVRDILQANDFVVLVVPIDSAAPK